VLGLTSLRRRGKGRRALVRGEECETASSQLNTSMGLITNIWVCINCSPRGASKAFGKAPRDGGARAGDSPLGSSPGTHRGVNSARALKCIRDPYLFSGSQAVGGAGVPGPWSGFRLSCSRPALTRGLTWPSACSEPVWVRLALSIIRMLSAQHPRRLKGQALGRRAWCGASAWEAWGFALSKSASSLARDISSLTNVRRMRGQVGPMQTVDIPPNHTLYVKNINDKLKKEVTKKQLYMAFSQYGRILDVVACKGEALRGQVSMHTQTSPAPYSRKALDDPLLCLGACRRGSCTRMWGLLQMRFVGFRGFRSSASRWWVRYRL
jgi:hypothetical protein